jgi:hypothetical protein
MIGGSGGASWRDPARGGAAVTFNDVLSQTIAMLQQHGRVSYRALKRQFALDDDYLEDLKEAILFAHPQVVDEARRGLVWTVDTAAVSITQARAALSTAIAIYQSMAMTFWLPQAEAALAQVEGNSGL